MTTIPYQQSLFELQAKLAVAIAQCNRYERKAHTVRNCISDQEHELDAWRERQRIEYQIKQLNKGE
jgi:hypothetical protein